jgi:hypothetical protein
MTLQAVVVGPVTLAGAGDGPAEVSFPGRDWAGPASDIKTITTGGTAQNLALARSARSGWLLQNLSNGDLWVEDTANPVVNGSILVPSGKMFVCPANMVTTGILKVLGATTGQQFVFKEAF